MEEIERSILFRQEVSRKIDGHKVKDYFLIPEEDKSKLSEEEQETARPIKLAVYDQHFIQHIGEEHCIRPTCSGCRYLDTCQNAFERIDLSGAYNIRRAFIAREGYSIAAIDYSGIELRVAANIAQEDVWINAFLGGKDIHEETARAIFKDSVDQDFKFKRKLAKCVTGDTRIKIQFTSGSVLEVPIEVLFAGLPDAEEDTFIPAPMNLYVINEYGEPKKVDELYYGGEQDTIKLELENGTTLEGSHAHRVRVIDVEGDYVWKYLDDVAEDDVIVTYEP